MQGFSYRDGVLHAEDVSVPTIAGVVGTPFYCYSAGALVANYRAFVDAFVPDRPLVCYAMKANSNLAVIRTFADLGAGADVVSEGELRRALAAGVPADRIVFSGVGKTRAEMAHALAAGVWQMNVESEPELMALSEVAHALGTEVAVALRVNPDVAADTHAKIATGKAENKFGIDIDRAAAIYARAAALPGTRPVGLAVHIGSQITDLSPLRHAFAKLAGLVRALREQGLPVERLDLGGGLGIRYDSETTPDLGEYAAIVRETVGPLGCHLSFEPGRLLVGNAGILVTAVVFEKVGRARRFVIVDAAMNDLLRPTLYDAYHRIVPVTAPGAAPGAALGGAPTEDAALSPADVVGPVCETGDTFASGRLLPATAPGDLLAILSAGAYGAVMASTYNTRPLIPEILVRGGDFAVVRQRQEHEDVFRLDAFADWQQSAGSR